MKFALVLLVSISASFAAYSATPCQAAAKKAVITKLGQEAEYCEVKLTKKSLSSDVVSFLANISCVGEGGFYDMHDFVVLKYKKNASGKYVCTLQ
jgi:hypothetical protein